MGMRIALAAAVALCTLPAAHAGLFHRASTGSGSRAAAIALRKRVHVNTLITEPGTLEIDWGGAFSTTGDFTLPVSIKYTPEGPHVWWGRTEFSANFDSVASTTPVEQRVTHFSDRVNFAATCVVHDGAKLDIAIAPQTTVLLRDDQGTRTGATLIARYDVGRSSAGVTFTWTGASAPSATNPSGTFDLGAGYGYRLKPAGALGHLTAHANWLWERSTGIARQISVFEGVEYQITEKVAVDFSAQHLAAWGGTTDHQIVVALNYNTGKLHRRAR